MRRSIGQKMLPSTDLSTITNGEKQAQYLRVVVTLLDSINVSIPVTRIMSTLRSRRRKF